MIITVNGEKKKVKDNITIFELINELKVLDKVMAAAVNMEIVKKEKWTEYRLKENDKLELLNFVGGG